MSMWPFWQKRLETGLLTEAPELERRHEQLRRALKNAVVRHFAGSLAIRMVDSGSCNACEAECNALSNPYYALERLGIHFVASPRHADVMLLSGVITANMWPYVMDCYQQLPAPRWVIALGDCPVNLSVFGRTFAIRGPADEHLPVAHVIPGCPPEPVTIMQGLLDFLTTLDGPNTPA